MSYLPTPAGHEDAPLEQSVTRANGKFEPMITELERLILGKVHDYSSHVNFAAWKKKHAEDGLTLSMQDFETVLHDARFSSLDTTVRSDLYAALAPFLTDRVIRYAEGVRGIELTRDPLSHKDRNKGRVCVVETSLSWPYHLRGPALTILRCGAQNSPMDVTSEVIVTLDYQFGEEKPKFSSPEGRQKPVYIINANPSCSFEWMELDTDPFLIIDVPTKRLTETFFDRETFWRKHRFENDITEEKYPLLLAYARELVDHCYDPYAIHGRYGPTPGPRIRSDLRLLTRPGGALRYKMKDFARRSYGRVQEMFA